ncbi:MAG: DUF308 domain-containing protein [Rothia sp. (in: high G+C Gram-positive bacteria)]|nr:DUF308 domain-containing protein [Rothia sp. (in: high G+C Gram-positive bacteria)]
MTHQPNTAPTATDPRFARALATPTATHALVFLTFGLVTVFWQQPTLGVITVMLGLYLLAYGAASFFTSRALLKEGDNRSAQVFTSMAAIQAGAGVLTFLLPRGEFWLTLVVSLALGFTGVLKLLTGMRTKGANPAARDWQLEGAIITVFAAALPVVSEIGDKAIMGTAGAGALLAGVFVMIGALSLRSAGRQP